MNYKHAGPGDMEHTCYVKFDLFTSPAANNPAFQQHGYATARVTVTGDPSIKSRIWPSFWLEGRAAWPTYGEIDNAEYMAGQQNWTTHTNLHGGAPSGGDVQRPAVVDYGKPGLGDINVSHVYGIEWQYDAATKGYILRTYFDNVQVGKDVILSGNPGVYPDAAIIKGLTNKDGNGMQIVFDADDIGSNVDPHINPSVVKNLPTLNYTMTVTDINAYTVR